MTLDCDEFREAGAVEGHSFFVGFSPWGGAIFLTAGRRAAVKERESKQAKRYADYRFACLLFRRMEK